MSQLRVLAHKAYFQWGPIMWDEQIFIKVTNTSDKPVELTHIWFQGEPTWRNVWRRRYWTAGVDGTHITRVVNPNPSRRLPVVLQPAVTFETWLPAAQVPGNWPLWRARAKLSSGHVGWSRPNKDVPDLGEVAGGGDATSTD